MLTGRRIAMPFAPSGALIGDWPSPGDYWRDEEQGWFGCTPNGHLASLARHAVVEHDDGTITVDPSILVHGQRGGGIQVTDGRTELWHGYLQRGVWREC